MQIDRGSEILAPAFFKHNNSYIAVCDLPMTDLWSCCTALQPCGYGGGDCDNDGECAGSLLCGIDNCGGIVDSGADCCIYPSKELKNTKA